MHNPDHGPVRFSLLLFPFYRWETRTPVPWTKGKKTQNLRDLCLKTSSAAAAKSLQSCPTLCDPIDGSSPGSPVPGILQARTLEWVAISFSSAWKGKVKVKSLSHIQLFATPWTAAYQAPPWDFLGKSTGVGCGRSKSLLFLMNSKLLRTLLLRLKEKHGCYCKKWFVIFYRY